MRFLVDRLFVRCRLDDGTVFLFNPDDPAHVMMLQEWVKTGTDAIARIFALSAKFGL